MPSGLVSGEFLDKFTIGVIFKDIRARFLFLMVLLEPSLCQKMKKGSERVFNRIKLPGLTSTIRIYFRFPFLLLGPE